MRKHPFLLSASLPLALAAAGGYRLDRSPHEPRDLVSLQSGARTFVNYCLGCHGVQYMRYNGLTDLGLTEAQIQDNLMFTADKVGETMKAPLEREGGQDLVRRDAARPVGDRALARRRLAVHLPAHLLPRPEDRHRLEQRRCFRTSPCRTRCGRCRASARSTQKTHKLTEISKGTQR